MIYLEDSENARPKKWSVAMLDNEAALVQATAAVFEHSGFDVAPLSTADAFTTIVADGGFDAFVLDWQLDPESTTADLIRSLRRMTVYADAPIILYTGCEIGGVSGPSPDFLTEFGLVLVQKPQRPTSLVFAVKAYLAARSAAYSDRGSFIVKVAPNPNLLCT